MSYVIKSQNYTINAGPFGPPQSNPVTKTWDDTNMSEIPTRVIGGPKRTSEIFQAQRDGKLKLGSQSTATNSVLPDQVSLIIPDHGEQTLNLYEGQGAYQMPAFGLSPYLTYQTGTLLVIHSTDNGDGSYTYGIYEVEYQAPAPPTMTITSSTVTSGSISDLFQQEITFEPNELIKDGSFNINSITTVNGTMSEFQENSSVNTYTATFTPTAQGLCKVIVEAGKFYDFDDMSNVASSNHFQWTYQDSIAPTITNYSPSQEGTLTSNSANIELTFNENVVKGTGNIVLTPSSGSAITIDVTNTSFVTFSSNKCTINPSSDLDATGLLYTVTMASGVIKDSAGNNFAGISGTTYQFNSKDITAPTITNYSPSHQGTLTSNSDNIELTFNENVVKGTGNIVLTPSSGEAITINVNDVTFSSNKCTINPSSDLSNLGLTYTVTMASGVIKDSAGNNFAGISGTTYQFNSKDTTAPTMTITSSAVTSDSRSGAFPVSLTFTSDEPLPSDGESGAFTAGHVTATNGTIDVASFTTVSSTVYTATFTPSGDGVCTVKVLANKYTDTTGNNNTASNEFSWTYDTTGPQITIDAMEVGNDNKVGPNSYNTPYIRVTFTSYNDPLPSDGEPGAFTSGHVEATNGTFDVNSFSRQPNGSYRMNFTPADDGECTVNVLANKFTDTAGNYNIASNQFSFTYDTTRPIITITTNDVIAGSISKKSSFDFTFTADEKIIGFTINDITATNGNISSFNTVDPYEKFTATFTPTAQGTCSVDVLAGTYTDLQDNYNTASDQFSWTYQSDITGPEMTITSSTVTSGSTSTISSVQLTFTSDEPLPSDGESGAFTAGHITATNGASTMDVHSFTTVSSTVYTATFTPTANGPCTVKVLAGKYTDGAPDPNDNTASNVFSWTNYILTVMNITSSINNSDFSKETSISLTFTSTRSTTDFAVEDITVTNGDISNFSGSGTTYTATFTPLIEGLCTIDVNAGVFTDSTARTNAASNQFNWTFDSTEPNMTITCLTADHGGISSSEVLSFTFTSNEPISNEPLQGFVIEDIHVTGGSIDVNSFTTVSSTVYTANFSVVKDTFGSCTIDVNSNKYKDTALNPNVVASQFHWTYGPDRNISEWKDLSGKDNHFVPLLTSVGLDPPLFNNSDHRQNGLPGIFFEPGSGLKLNSTDHRVGPQTEINNCKTVFMVWQDPDSSRMTALNGGPPPLLGSDATAGSGKGFTMSDFGTSHTGTETFWSVNGTHNAIKAGRTRITPSGGASTEFTGVGTIKRSDMFGSVNMVSVQIGVANPNTDHGDGAGDRVGVVISGLGNSRNHDDYNPKQVIYELIVYTGNLDGVDRSANIGGTTHGNVGGSITTNNDLMSIEKYLKRKWGIGNLDPTAPTSLPDVTTNDCVLSLHLDSSDHKISDERKAQKQALDLGIQNTILDSIKTAIPIVPSSGKVALSAGLITNLKSNIVGTGEQKRKKRSSLIKLLFSQNTLLKKMGGIKASDLDLPTTFTKPHVEILRSGETVDLSEFVNSSAGFYCPLSNSETIDFTLNSKSFTFIREDYDNDERYKLNSSDWTDVTITTDSSTFDTDNNNNTLNYFTPDDNVTIKSGDKSHSFFIGSIGDASPSGSNIYLTAGNRVYLDNTRSDGVNLASFQVDGGSYIKKDVYIGGNLNISDSATILSTEAEFNTDEVVFDNPLLLIGQNNTGDNLLGGIMNRYQDNSNNYKFTGLIKHNLGTKPYVLVNEVDADTTNNKDINSTNLDTVVSNSSNNYKDNYSNINIDKLKSLSSNFTNNEDIGIYTKGSLGISKNVYIGNINHTNGNIQIGSDTNIQYEKNNDGKFNLKTNVDLDLKAVADGANSKSISYTSDNNLNYTSSQQHTTNITTNLIETINNDLSTNVEGSSIETYKKDLHTITNINKLTHHLPFYNNINSTSRTDITGDMDTFIDGTNHFYLTNNITETFNKNKLINQNDLIENLKDLKNLTITKDMNNVYGNNHLNISKTQDIIVHTNNSETYVNINQTKHNNVYKTVGTVGTAAVTINYVVTAAAGKFLIDGVIAPSLLLKTNNTYNFDLTDSSLSSSHPFKLSTTSDGTHGGGTEYSAGNNNILTLTPSAPITLYYYCQNHPAMGGSIIITDSNNIKYNLNISTDATLYTDNNNLIYNKNLNDISENTTSNITGNYDLFLNKINNTEITGASSETYKKFNDITISNNLNQVVSGNSNITGLNTTNIYKKGIINLTEGNDSKTVKNQYDLVLNQNLSEVYGAKDSFNVGENLTINYNNSLTEIYNSSYTSVIDRTATVATTTNYIVTVSNNKYLIDGVSQASLELQPNNIYVFNLNDNSLNSHPFLLSTTNNGTHNSGAVYSTNVVYNIGGSTEDESNYLSGFASGSSRTLTLTPSAPITLYYYCHVHATTNNMGGIISVIESTNIINISNNRNTTIGTGISTNIDSLVIGNNLNILYVGDSNETYKSDLNSTSNNYNIDLSKQYNMICYNSTNTYNSCTIQYDNNLIETISNTTTSYRSVGGNGSAVTVTECVVRIHEGNSSIHKIPNQYVPGDVVDSVTLAKGDLVFFNYTPGQQTFQVTNSQQVTFNADLSALNGIYTINDL